MRTSLCVLVGSLLCTACSHSGAAPTPASGGSAAASQPLAANTPRQTQSGATFTAPAGWTVLDGAAGVTVLVFPEGDSRLALVEVRAATAEAAAEAAWDAYRPAGKRPLRVSTPRPARDGWDEVKFVDYETSPNERVTVYAVVRRQGSGWTVTLVDATEPSFERRIAQLMLVGNSLRPKGYAKESFAAKKAHPLDAARIAAMQDFIRAAQEQLGVPGVALGLIDQGKVVFEGGLGVRELGKPEPVDADTLFIAASNTKALTTLLLAELVDDGKFKWDTKVTDVLPQFKLGDAATTASVEIQHLVCACTGLPRQDMEWLFNFQSATAASTLETIGTLQPTTKFKEVFQYSNLLAAAGGYVAAHALLPDRELGAAYDEAMRTRVFEPLGMNETTFDFARAMAANLPRRTRGTSTPGPRWRAWT
jgi:hypothetical protein